MSIGMYLLQTAGRSAAARLGEAAVMTTVGYVGYKLFRHKDEKARREMGQEQLKVLEMVASGKISPVEGERLLAALSASHRPGRRGPVELPQVKLPRIDLSGLGEVALELKNTVVDAGTKARGKLQGTKAGSFIDPKVYTVAGPPLEGVGRCELSLSVQAGKLKLGAGETDGSVLRGKIKRVPDEPKIHAESAHGTAQVRLEHSLGVASLAASTAPEYSIKLENAAADTLLDLRQLKVNDLNIENNAGSVTARLGASQWLLKINIQSNAGGVKLELPGSHALRIVATQSMSTANFEGLGLKNVNGGLQSGDWDVNDKRCELVLVQNVASLELDWPRQPGEGLMSVVEPSLNGAADDEVPAGELD